jgi:hypothetical protein
MAERAGSLARQTAAGAARKNGNFRHREVNRGHDTPTANPISPYEKPVRCHQKSAFNAAARNVLLISIS